MSYSEEIQKLFDDWSQKSGMQDNITINHKQNCFIRDGIVNLDEWRKSDNKILFVLKEARGTGWDKEHTTGWGKEHTLATWLNDSGGGKYPTWKYVAQWTEGIEKTTDTHVGKYKEKLEDETRKTIIRKIAIMNLKKSDGNSSSNDEELQAYARFDKDELKKEFELIDADIIVCGSTFGILYEIIYEQPPLNSTNGKPTSDNMYYFFELGGRKRLFIDYYHPSLYPVPDIMKYYGLVGIYHQALIEKVSHENLL